MAHRLKEALLKDKLELGCHTTELAVLFFLSVLIQDILGWVPSNH